MFRFDKSKFQKIPQEKGRELEGSRNKVFSGGIASVPMFVRERND